MPRAPQDGGPYLRYSCRACGRTSHVERNRAGALLAGPPPIVPLADRVFALFDREHALEVSRKKEHERRRPDRRTWFFGLYADELLEAGWKPGRSRPVPDAGRAGPGPGPKPGPEPKTGPRPDQRRPPPPADSAPPPPVTPPPPPPKGPHEVLGVAATASRDEVEAAFREQAKRYHPDRFAALDPEFLALAERRFKELGAAREELLERLPPEPTPPTPPTGTSG